MKENDRRKALTVLGMGLLSVGCTTSIKQQAISRPEKTTPKQQKSIREYRNFEMKRRYVNTPYGRIAYVEAGAGKPAVFLHGLAMNSFYWSGQLAELASQRRCIAVDLMAHGYTKIDSNQSVTFTDQAAMVLSFMDHLGLAEVDLVGSDSGGAIAQIMAASQPHRINSMVLTNCDVHDNWPPAALESMRASAPNGALADTFVKLVANPSLVRTPNGLGSIVFEHPETLSDELVQIFLAPLVATPDRQAAFNRYAAPQNTDQLTNIESDLRTFSAPCLILWGTADIFFNLEWAYWLEKTLPNAKPVVEFEGAKLFFPFERYQKVNEHIQAFWKELDRV